MKKINLIILAGLISLSFLACEINLGAKLDLEGPTVAFESPSPREAMPAQFNIIGTVSDSSGIAEVLLTAKVNNGSFAKQWRYDGSSWQFSEDHGSSWAALPGAEWTGDDKSGRFKLPIDVRLAANGIDLITGEYKALDGEYMFFLQAWDKSGVSDENSFKTRVFIVDNDPPKIAIEIPYLYPKTDVSQTYSSGKYEVIQYEPGSTTTERELYKLHSILDNDIDARTNPANIGKFLTHEFNMEWQVDENHDIYSIDILFYDLTEEIDELSETQLNINNAIYQFTVDVTQTGSPFLSQGTLKPNGSIIVPDLTVGCADTGRGKVNYSKLITEKTTIRVVGVCHDIAGNVTQEKTLGFFVYWPLADYPWISYTGKMEGANFNDLYNREIKTFNGDNIFLVYPNKPIKARAFQVNGVEKVSYTLYKVEETINGWTQNDPGSTDSLTVAKDEAGKDCKGTVENPNFTTNKGITTYDSIFSWEFLPPAKPGFYAIIAEAHGNKERASNPTQKFESYFRIQDTSFPDFREEIQVSGEITYQIGDPQPVASEPLYKVLTKHVSSGGPSGEEIITIKGFVSDANNIKSLAMVWINPESPDYAAMSQLEFFRDKNFPGWLQAVGDGSSTYPGLVIPSNKDYVSAIQTEGVILEANNQKTPHTNRIWRIKPNPVSPKSEFMAEDETIRKIYEYSVEIPLKELNIFARTIPAGSSLAAKYLNSQVFLLRVENNDSKCTIVTYSPQGDTSPPEIKISGVTISRGINTIATLKPREPTQVPIFEGGELITITGDWKEDSSSSLNLNNYFQPYFKVNINDEVVPANDIKLNTPTSDKWTATYTVDSTVAKKLKDTLVVGVKTNDVGGNITEAGASWLIETDTLRLNRISADEDDTTYTKGKTIRIFLEFNKPVRFKGRNLTGTERESISLNTGGKAYYRTNQNLSTMHYFDYLVGDNENTPSLQFLNITDINIKSSDTSDITLNNYPFSFTRPPSSGTGPDEEIKITKASFEGAAGHDGKEKPAGKDYYMRSIPVNDNTASLKANKHITINTNPLEAVSVSTNTDEGYYKAGSIIYFTVEFDREVVIKGIPRLNLTVGAKTRQTDDIAPSVNGKKVTFQYKVPPSTDPDSSNGNEVTIGTGNITVNDSNHIADLAGNRFPQDGFSALNYTLNRELTKIRIDNVPPAAPVLKLYSNNSPVIGISQIVGNTTTATTGESSTALKNLNTIHNEKLWLSIQKNTPATTGTTTNYDSEFDCDYLEYSINYGESWKRFDNTTDTPILLEQLAASNNRIIARQVDKASNFTVWNGCTHTPKHNDTCTTFPAAGVSYPLQFNYNPGNIISRVSSTSPNGVYTNVSGKNTINITVYFREPVYLTNAAGNGAPAANSIVLTLNATNAAYPAGIPIYHTAVTGAISELSFTYTVQNGDVLPAPVAPATISYLKAMSISGLYIRHGGTNNTTGVKIEVPNSTAANTAFGTLPAFDTTKYIQILTGTLGNPSNFVFNDAQKGTDGNPLPGLNTETSGNFHGISKSDGSYWTTLEFEFDRPVTKGTATEDLVITQIQDGYKLPTVLNETQYNRFRASVVNTTTGALLDVDTYYTKGTNGFDAGTNKSDTSSKYILQYRYNPQRRTGAAFAPLFTAGGSTVTLGPDADTEVGGNANYYDNFRNAEAIKISVNSTYVKVDGNKVRVRLSGSNAPQVPGAKYEVKVPAKFVQDSLGNESAAFTTATPVQLGGVAKPFVRIRKVQDTIATATAGASQPRLVATQPMYAFARIDSRTPGANIRYYETNANATENVDITDKNESNNNWRPSVPAYGTGAKGQGPWQGTTTGVPGVPTTPAYNSGTVYPEAGTTPNYQIRIGNENYTGLQWRIKAIAYNSSNIQSFETEEVAYRTVISYILRQRYGHITATETAYSVLGGGDQVWIRGGDAISSSTTPGFPFTWEDEWGGTTAGTAFQNKRAGIRLMTNVSRDKVTIVTGGAMTAGTNQYATTKINTADAGNYDFGNTTIIPVTVGTGTTIYWLRPIETGTWPNQTRVNFRLYNSYNDAYNANEDATSGINTVGASPEVKYSNIVAVCDFVFTRGGNITNNTTNQYTGTFDFGNATTVIPVTIGNGTQVYWLRSFASRNNAQGNPDQWYNFRLYNNQNDANNANNNGINTHGNNPNVRYSTNGTSNGTGTYLGSFNFGNGNNIIPVTVDVGTTVGTTVYWLRSFPVGTTNSCFRLYTTKALAEGGGNGDYTPTNPVVKALPLNNSMWKFVSWEINTVAYVDFIRGVDTGSSAAVAWQYGPKQWSLQRAGWTAFKSDYPVYPGKHRICDTGYEHEKGAINFSNTLSTRLDSTNNNNWNATPGVNSR